MKNWIKKITGIAAIEEAAMAAEQKRKDEEFALAKLKEERESAELAAKQAYEDEEYAKLSPKERAIRNKEPWINVLDVKINENNIRNGFFELDWNEFFVQELIQNGYGTEADPEEEIVDRWFRDIVFQMLSDEGLDTSRNSGYINVVPIDKGRSEIS